VIACMAFAWTNAAGGSHGDRCSASDKCDSNQFLNCTGGLCGCNNGFEYKPNRGVCEVQFNRVCSTSILGPIPCDKDKILQCIHVTMLEERCSCGARTRWTGEFCQGLVGGRCGPHPTQFFLDTCISNAFCNGNTCACKDNYAPTMDYGCQKTTYESDCNEKRQCDNHHFLDCIGGKCICEKPDGMMWDNKDECVALVGEECDKNSWPDTSRELDCVAGADCVINGKKKGICRCRDNGNTTDVGGCSNDGYSLKKNCQSMTAFISIVVIFQFILSVL